MLKPVLDISDKPKLSQWFPLSLQHVFAMFGATVLVPFLTGLSPAVALACSGLGTLLFIFITKAQVPAYLGSSFAFIVPIIEASKLGGVEAALWGGVIVGVIYILISIIVKLIGVNWLKFILPPVVTGSIIMVIGISLAGTAVKMAFGIIDTNSFSLVHAIISIVTLLSVIIFATYGRGFLSLVPVLMAIIIGFSAAVILGSIFMEKPIVDLYSIIQAPVISIPEFVIPSFSSFDIIIVLSIAPIALVTLTEHLGDTLVLGRVTNRNFWEKPGLHRTILGDGLATVLSSLIGGPPNTTYGENTGVMAVTRVYSIWVVGFAAIIAVFLSFSGTTTMLIKSIPTSVMGGVSILLFGTIAASGLRTLIDNKVNLSENKNLIIVSIILIIGVGGSTIEGLSGMGLATITGVFLNLILPSKNKTILPVEETQDNI